MSKDYRVYILNDCDWVVAENKKQAVECWERTTSETFNEYGEKIFLEKKHLSELDYWYDVCGERKTTFEKRINEVLESGEEKVPFFLASSEY